MIALSQANSKEFKLDGMDKLRFFRKSFNGTKNMKMAYNKLYFQPHFNVTKHRPPERSKWYSYPGRWERAGSV